MLNITDLGSLRIRDYVIIERKERIDPAGKIFSRNHLIIYTTQDDVSLRKKKVRLN